MTISSFNISEIDDRFAQHSFIGRKFDVGDFNETSDQLVRFDIKDSINLDRLKTEILKKIDRFGFQGFTNLYSENASRVSFYGGLGLTWNPEYIFPDVLPHQQVLGAPRKNAGGFFDTENGMRIIKKIMQAQLEKDFFYGFLYGSCESTTFKHCLDAEEFLFLNQYFEKIERIPDPVKNSYSDSWGFSHLTEVASTGYLGEILRLVPYSIVRSRIGVLRTHNLSFENKEKLWHRDENPWLESRIVIPIEIPSCTEIQIRDREVRSYPLEVGKAYFWDTTKVHRVIQDSSSERQSINLIIAISPWFDIDNKRRTITPSSHFKKPLLELFRSDEFIPFLKYDRLLK